MAAHFVLVIPSPPLPLSEKAEARSGVGARRPTTAFAACTFKLGIFLFVYYSKRNCYERATYRVGQDKLYIYIFFRCSLGWLFGSKKKEILMYLVE